MQCQCKAWITPAVHIQPGKIDECRISQQKTDECQTLQQTSDARPTDENPNEEPKA